MVERFGGSRISATFAHWLHCWLDLHVARLTWAGWLVSCSFCFSLWSMPCGCVSVLFLFFFFFFFSVDRFLFVPPKYLLLLCMLLCFEGVFFNFGGGFWGSDG